MVLALLGFWLLLPLVQFGQFAEDAVPFIAAGRVVDDHPDGIYATQPDRVPDALYDAGCPFVPVDQRCDELVLPFISPPQVLPAMALFGSTSDATAVLLIRLLGAASFAGGFWILWRRVTDDAPEAEMPMLMTAVLLTPVVQATVTFGQNAPLMFLSAAIGLGATARGSRALGAAAVWVATVVSKLFPLALVVVALVNRRWRFLAWSAALLAATTALTVVVAPTAVFGAFVDSTRALAGSRVDSASNISIDAGVHHWIGRWEDEGALFAGFLAARVAAVAGLFWWRLRHADDDVQWSYAWVALLFLHTQIWWHYFAVLIPAVATALRGRRGGVWWAVPGAALAVSVLAVVNDADTLVVLGPAVLVTAVFGLPFLSRPASGRSDQRIDPTAETAMVSASA